MRRGGGGREEGGGNRWGLGGDEVGERRRGVS